MNELYTFEQILTQGIESTEKGFVHVDSILIPRIQRSYAQGRKNESAIREEFLKEIFKSLVEDKVLELNFIYGSLEKSDEGNLFLLLDGQQRLTTLFLLYWYVANVEKENIPDYISHFKYETRTTSSDFIKDITKKKITLIDTPSATIRKSKWFSLSYDSDPTISAMLIMLDAIHSKYIECKEHNLFERLKNIKFYVLLLENFGLSEELYIKMNARGLPLTPFENFKADLIRVMQENKISDFSYEVEYENPATKKIEKIPFDRLFSTKLDTIWTDVFWNKKESNMKEFSRRFFCFFMRYFANKYYLLHEKEKSVSAFSEDENFEFLNEKSETQNDRYLGFDIYNLMLRRNHTLIKDIDKVLDLLHKHYDEDIFPLLIPNWEKVTKQPFDLFETKTTRYHKMIFAAITEYLEACETFDLVNFKRWMRILWNIVENIDFNKDEDQIAHARKLSYIIRLPQATSDIYLVLSNFTNDNLKCISEEAIKAREIVSHREENWEEAFIEAESHNFFAGMINFFFEPNKGVDVFRHRYKIIKEIFDADGINKQYTKNHILLRAMFAQVKDFETLNKFILVESELNTEDKTILKNELSNIKCFHKLFFQLGDLDSSDKIIPYLENILIHEYNIEWIENKNYDNNRLKKAFHLLLHDPNLLNFAFNEKKLTGKSVVIRDLYGSIAINRNQSTSSRIYIDSDWSTIATGFIKQGGYKITDPDVEIFFQKYNYYKGYNIQFFKEIKNYQINIIFRFNKIVDVYILCPTKSCTNKILKEINVNHIQDNWVGYDPIAYVPFSDTYDNIYMQIAQNVKEIEEWVNNQ